MKVFYIVNLNSGKSVIGAKLGSVVDILTKKVAEENVDESYLLDFIDLEVLEMNKVEFIKEYGSKRAKIILVDSMLSI